MIKSKINFFNDLSRGKAGEELIDRYYKNIFEIEEVTLASERGNGIDRVYRFGDNVFTVEYKFDFRARKTGNAYIEVLIEESDGRIKDGCIKKTQADILMYLCNNLGLYILYAKELKADIAVLQEKYGLVSGPWNNGSDGVGFRAKGMLIPLGDLFEQYGEKFIPFSELMEV